MPLVDYASSDEESESEVIEKNENLTEKKQVSATSELSDSISGDDGQLFSSLPKPRKTFSFLDDDNKLSKLRLCSNSVPTGKRENVKITVPSISEFKNDTEEPLPKKIKPTSKGAGLFSILPPPKNTAVTLSNVSLVPQVVSQSKLKQSVKRSMTDKFMKATQGDEDDDDVPVGSSFFGSSLIEQPSESDQEKMSNESTSFKETFGSSTISGNSSGGDDFNTSEQNSNLALFVNTNDDNSTNLMNFSQESETVSASDNPLKLDEKALQILCGNKKKRQQMPMNIIDLSSEEVLPDSKEWLLKQFTEEKRTRSHSHKKTHGPSSQSRRKHQITYLAYQAKEQELELQNQWAQNRMTRKQTQSKYGF